ncbi:MAG: succinyldiaminopimelate transaminase [Pseudomonadota bacterium]
MNERLDALQPYPFERLRTLLGTLDPGTERALIRLSIGEPKHPAPDFVLDALADRDLLRDSLGRYPATRGLPELRQALASWLSGRYTCTVDAEQQVLPVAGTREALFAVAQALLPTERRGLVRLPNPFYQIYEGAALLAGAAIAFYDGDGLETTGPAALGRLTADDWQQTDLLYLCSPGNPSGAVWSTTDLERLAQLAQEHNFIVLADECYSEIYRATAPTGLLRAAVAAGYPDFDRCLVFNSLSKRSNLPGLRSGLVAGDAELLERFLRYRTYQGCALPVHTQIVSALAWGEETHVEANRERYRHKLAAAAEGLEPLGDWRAPPAGFCFWLPVSLFGFADDEDFARTALGEQQLEVLPGRYLARPGVDGQNPGVGRVRVAWVAPEADCAEAGRRLLALRRSG